MDRFIHTALNSVSIQRDTRALQAQNLANMNVPGYRRDLENDGRSKFLSDSDGVTARVFQLDTGPNHFSHQPGFMDRTDVDTDVAIADYGYFYIRPQDGEPALSRRGDMRRDIDGILRNGAGDAMLGQNLEPIQVADFRNIRITDIGEIYIEPVDFPPGQSILAGTLATVMPNENEVLRKGPDGEIRREDGTLPEPNQGAEVLQGVLEGSNVNALDEMVSNIDTQRSFEVAMRMIMMAKELDESGAAVMQAPMG